MKRLWDFIAPFVRWIVLTVLVFVALAVMIRFLGIQPPKEFTLATGRQGGAYYAFAEQYRERFAEEGYTVNIRETAGSIETLELLNVGEVDVGFIQNVVYDDVRADPELSTLASLFYEAMWVFYRNDLAARPHNVADLAGLRINVGEEGSATQTSSRAILALNGITQENSTLLTLSSAEAAQQLKDGGLDAAIFVAGASSPLVRDLALTPEIELLPFSTADAYASRYKNVTAVVLPAGVIDIAKTVPAEDIPLIAARATLVASDKLHPDLARLLLIIAAEIHSEGGILEKSGEFPNAEPVEIPLNADAVRYLENGPTGLERYLPLWLASRLERLLFLLLPVALILYPLLRGVPSLVAYFNQYRIKRRYQRLREIEKQYTGYNLEELDAAIADLESFQRELNEQVNVPTTMLDELYDLRMHTRLTLDRLYAQRNTLKTAD
ncbi:MAG: TAXI family TRAP transporter solute-binding subunit [Anaerolineales bacterium]